MLFNVDGAMDAYNKLMLAVTRSIGRSSSDRESSASSSITPSERSSSTTSTRNVSDEPLFDGTVDPGFQVGDNSSTLGNSFDGLRLDRNNSSSMDRNGGGNAVNFLAAGAITHIRIAREGERGRE